MSETNNKQFILAGGQPGSGKTNLVETIKRDNPNVDFIVIDLDKYRIMHPDFKNIIKQDKSKQMCVCYEKASLPPQSWMFVEEIETK